MQDEEYQPDQIPSYGTGEQLALAARMRPQLRLTQIGNGFAVLGVLAAVAALVTYPRILYGDDAGWAYAVGALICSVVLLALCTFQHFCWLRAMAVWRGQSSADLRQLSTLSHAAQIAAYVVGIAALWACIAGIVFAGWTATAAILLMLALAFMLTALVMAGIQYVRTTGPPGIVPAHMRRLVERDNVRR